MRGVEGCFVCLLACVCAVLLPRFCRAGQPDVFSLPWKQSHSALTCLTSPPLLFLLLRMLSGVALSKPTSPIPVQCKYKQ